SYVGDYRWYSAYGGGVFLDERCKAEFVECTIRGNQTFGGLTGQGGTKANGRIAEPLIPFEIPSYGGGVYCAADTTVTFRSCNFANNSASVPAAGQPNFRMDPYVGFGGGVAAEFTASVLFVDCNFVNNEADTGGALYLADTVAKVYDTEIVRNVAIRGAGVAGVGGDITVGGTEVRNNLATIDPTATADVGVLPMGGGFFLSSATARVQDCNIAGNSSEGSGGGLYLRGENSSTIVNCLILSNLAFRDGGGISTNWYATPTIRNCTFVGNSSPGNPTDTTSGFGGGLFCGSFSDAKVVDSIFWKNGGRLGTELAVGTGFELDRQCGKLHVSYSNIIVGPNDVYVDNGCTLVYGDGVLRGIPTKANDPLFVPGPLGNFYLSPASPCVNAGSTTAGAAGMSRYTTRTDGTPDSGQVDMGYHYVIREPCKFCDLAYDGIIDFVDFARFATQWLNEGCIPVGGWCKGADFNFDSRVNTLDLSFFSECWLVRDTTPPMPDPVEWEEAPKMKSGIALLGGSIVVEMTAREAIDAWGWDVEYYFECVHGTGHDSGWIKSRVYKDTGLSRDIEYGYRVKARDALGNETKWSEVRFAGGADRTPPTPDPYILAIVADSPTQVTMTARIAYDESGVQYYFDSNTPGAHPSGWINDPFYTDVNLAPTTRYAYRVKARDLSSRTNETPWSGWAYVTTQTPTETTPPTPNPMTFDPNGMPTEISGGGGPFDFYVQMTATTATDASGGVQYFFLCVEYPKEQNQGGFSSGWINTPTFTTVNIGRANQGLHFRVRARDVYGNMTEWSQSVMAVPYSATVR
ncbi:MAG: right-handed parallel beta-helix repeat-containing protein, partial [Phycisphaerae bacterium]|nr:right-handed parallel beta-helix repeat-containing protein [Phycisphaerae bacterium]